MTQNRSNRAAGNRAATRTGRKRWRLLLGSLFVVALCATIRYNWGAAPAKADAPPNSSARATASTPSATRTASNEKGGAPARANVSDSSIPAVVATVNTQRITREDLARQCRRSSGKEILESMVNKHLIVQECQRQGITVTRAEVDAEIERMAKRFNIPVDQWLKMIKQERNITPSQYANDIIWTTLALRKLAGERLTVSHDELVKEFEIEYGDAVRARLIAVSSPEKAKSLQAKAAARPEEFGNLAKDYSEDAPSASAKGMINPIRKHGSYKEIEDAVFNMADGDVSPVIHAGGQYVILKREKLLPARPVKFEAMVPQLEEILRSRKMRPVADDIFQQLQKDARIENVWNDPAKHERMPGVAATINDVPITIRELDEECLARHGQDILEGMISRKVIEQACQKRNVTVTEKDLEAEIIRQATANVKPKRDGSPDVEAWLELITKKQSIPLDVYRNDVVWPAVALQKLVGDKVSVTDDDLRKGFEANYGPRVRCLAIVLSNLRTAQQVFEMARKKNTSEYFGELASQYSVEPSSQQMRGEVPPIKKYGGQPTLEEEAFQLQPGELSGVIQVADKFIILRCEAHLEGAKVDFAKVRNEIDQDLREKKLQLAVEQCFEQLQEAATVDNYLAGTSHSPKQHGEASSAAKVPLLRQAVK